MRRSHPVLLRARSLLFAGLVIVGPSLLLAGPAAAGRTGIAATAAPAADARGGSRTVERTVRLHGSDVASRAANRAARHVVAKDLPKATGHETVYQPKQLTPKGFAKGGSSRAPSSTLAAPTQATVTGTNPATEAVHATGIVADLLEPPDPTIAAGPDHVIQATNEGIRISDRDLDAVGADLTLSAFFGIDAIGGGYQAVTFDPHVLFDTAHNRWLATEASFDCYPDAANGVSVGTGYIDIAISDTADPTGGWSILSVPYPDTVPDYPGLGTSTDKIVVSSNVFPLVSTGGGACDADGGTFIGTELDVVSWAQMLGSGAVDLSFLTDYIDPVDFGTLGSLDYFALRPAVQTSALASPAFGVGSTFTTGAIVWFKVIGLPSSGNAAVQTIAPVSGLDPLSLPPDPQQPSGTIANAVDGRLTDAVWQNNRLAFVATAACDPAGGGAESRDCVRVGEIGVSASTTVPAVTQDMLIAETGRDLYMAGIGFSVNSDLHVVWTGSSSTANDFPSTYHAYQLRGQTANSLVGRQKISAGTTNYTGSRWGDYVTVAQDPQVPDAVWQADEFSTGDWATEVSQLTTFGGASYTPITPVRIFDSRATTKLAANTARTFQVTGVAIPGSVTIPTSAIAVTGNVTITGQTAAGYVSVTPTATNSPTSSTINFPTGDVRANNFTLPLGSGGKLSAVYKAAAGKTTNVIVDITGYFTAGNSAATYVPLDPPSRILDSRGATGGFAGVPFSSGVPRDLQVTGVGGVPTGAVAITGNLTVVSQTKAGYLSVTPDHPSATPSSSTMNFPVGDIRANGLTTALDGSGKLSITLTAPGGTAHVLLDVTGYYLDDTSGKLFYPLSPGRILESRDSTTSLTGLHGAFAANTARTLPAAGHWGVPGDAVAVTGNLTVVGQTQAGYVAVTPVETNTPPTSTINFPLGDVRANGITVPLATGSMGLVYKAGTGRTTHLVLDVTGYFK